MFDENRQNTKREHSIRAAQPFQPCGKSSLTLKQCDGDASGDLLLSSVLAAAHLLALEVLVEKVECGLVGLGGAHDGEHTLTSLIMRSLGDGDASTGGLADLRDLAATTADDASDHVRWDGDVLGLDLLSVLVVGWDAASDTLTVRATVEGAWSLVATDSGAAGLSADNWVVEDGALATLPIVDEALADLPDGSLNALWVTLNLDDALGRLWEHLLLGDHTDTRDILDVLDLESLATDDGTHLVVGDKELDSVGSVSGNNTTHSHHWSTLNESLGDNGIGLGDGIATTRDGQDAVVDTLDDLGDTGLDASLIAKVGNVLASLADDNTSLLGGDDGTESELLLGVLLISLWGEVSIWTHAVTLLADVEVGEAVSNVADWLLSLLLGRHCN